MKNLFLFLGIILMFGCKQNTDSRTTHEIDSADDYHRTVKNLTDIIVHDIFSPPVASRVYVYSNIAAYEILQLNDPNFASLSGQLRGLKNISKPTKDISYTIAALEAFCTVGRALIFSEDQMVSYMEKLRNQWSQQGIDQDIIDQSITYGQDVAKEILQWAATDKYNYTRTLGSYQIKDKPNTWTPTPPDFMPAIEPYWNQIIPLCLDSAQQFKPVPPTPFDITKGSPFYKEVMTVYDAVSKGNQEQKEIALFWDCNPYQTYHEGHFMYGRKKITPGGHWIGITQIACKKNNLSFIETVNAYTRVSIGLFDAFISCWDEKYRSNLIRPETVINQYMDPEWKPILQTPPFPEYTSGHSVVSAASATILTHLLGEGFDFLDTSEVEYGLPERSFTSFYEASDEAAISRLYGGIHYMPAITNGVAQGKKVGAKVIQTIQTKIQSSNK